MRSILRKLSLTLLLTCCVLFIYSMFVSSTPAAAIGAEEAETVQVSATSAAAGAQTGLIAIAAAIAVGAGAVATGWVQSSVMPSVAALSAEDKSFRIFGILLIALPETILLFSLVVAIMLIGKMP